MSRVAFVPQWWHLGQFLNVQCEICSLEYSIVMLYEVFVNQCSQVRHKREELLNHPVVYSLIHYKWRYYGFLSYVLNLCFFALFLALLTAFALVVPNPQTMQCRCYVLNDTGVQRGHAIPCLQVHLQSMKPPAQVSIIKLQCSSWHLSYY